MEQLITGDDLYATVLMLKSADARTLVALEGPDDCACLAPHVDEVAAQVLPCHGSRNLERLVELVDMNAVPGVLAIRDRDWYGILTSPAASPNMVLTDKYDLDATILICTPVGERVALVFGDATAVGQHCSQLGAEGAISLVIRAASRLGLLRLASTIKGMSLALRNFPVGEVTDPGTVTIEDADLVSLAVSRSRECTLDAPTVEGLLNRVEKSYAHVRGEDLCCGRDIAAVMSFLIGAGWGGRRAGRDLLLMTVRAALSCTALQSLSLYGDVESWEQRTRNRVWACP